MQLDRFWLPLLVPSDTFSANTNHSASRDSITVKMESESEIIIRRKGAKRPSILKFDPNKEYIESSDSSSEDDGSIFINKAVIKESFDYDLKTALRKAVKTTKDWSTYSSAMNDYKFFPKPVDTAFSTLYTLMHLFAPLCLLLLLSTDPYFGILFLVSTQNLQNFISPDFEQIYLNVLLNSMNMLFYDDTVCIAFAASILCDVIAVQNKWNKVNFPETSRIQVLQSYSTFMLLIVSYRYLSLNIIPYFVVYMLLDLLSGRKHNLIGILVCCMQATILQPFDQTNLAYAFVGMKTLSLAIRVRQLFVVDKLEHTVRLKIYSLDDLDHGPLM